MGAPPPWELVASEELQDCEVFRVKRLMARSPHTGAIHPFYGIHSPPWINVVPVTPAGEIVMIRQFRQGSREVTLEIPGGMVDPGETPAEAAARELREETGYGGGTLAPIGAVNPNPALFDNRLHSFVARDVEPVGEIQNSPLEETRVELLPRAALRDLLRTGAIDHALVVAALLWFLLEEEADGGS
jgi:ADP-ribose pyrophosphatase